RVHLPARKVSPSHGRCRSKLLLSELSYPAMKPACNAKPSDVQTPSTIYTDISATEAIFVKMSRRDLHLLLPVLASAPAIAQTPAKPNVLPSKVYRTEDIPYTGDDRKK